MNSGTLFLSLIIIIIIICVAEKIIMVKIKNMQIIDAETTICQDPGLQGFSQGDATHSRVLFRTPSTAPSASVSHCCKAFQSHGVMPTVCSGARSPDPNFKLYSQCDIFSSLEHTSYLESLLQCISILGGIPTTCSVACA